jgi:alpha-D-ribose 1-methylphosphonate 5-triphosphate synthase subunit PhnG
MAVLARSSADDLQSRSAGLLPAYAILRGPETGLIMVRGRAGGGGAPFNLGEATVARCTVRSAEGQIGHAYCLGRDLRQAELAAALDAALQDPARHADIEDHVIAPLERAQAERRQLHARRAAATQVQFFTMATMRT